MNSLKTLVLDIRARTENRSYILLLLLLCGDFILIILNIIHDRNLPILRSSLFNIAQDGGYAEIYQYIKFFWIIILFIYIFRSTKYIGYVSWILMFIYFLIDDAMQIHERAGAAIAENLNFVPFFHLRLQDYGEMIVSLIIGILLFAILAWSYFRGSSDFRKISRDMMLFTIALIFCGVFIDMVGIAVSMGWAIEQSLQILEDGGEMVVLSLILCYVFTRIRMDKQNGKSNMTIQSGLSSQ